MTLSPTLSTDTQEGLADLPRGFVYAKALMPELCVDLAYFSSRNFVGERIVGYEANRLILTREATVALRQVQGELAYCGLALKVFDGYRPQRAVDRFVTWAHDATDLRMKAAYYPHIDKERLFPEGYLVALSTHSRGSTVDLTIIDKQSGEELDMGTPFDFFDPRSWPESRAVEAPQRAHRQLLRSVMHRHGFMGVPEEWWHFTLQGESFPDTYFDFVIR